MEKIMAVKLETVNITPTIAGLQSLQTDNRDTEYSNAFFLIVIMKDISTLLEIVLPIRGLA
jgi:hypothetical protein